MAKIFSIAYFLANWAFIAVFTFVFTRGLFFQQRQPFLDIAVDSGSTFTCIYIKYYIYILNYSVYI